MMFWVCRIEFYNGEHSQIRASVDHICDVCTIHNLKDLNYAEEFGRNMNMARMVLQRWAEQDQPCGFDMVFGLLNTTACDSRYFFVHYHHPQHDP